MIRFAKIFGILLFIGGGIWFAKHLEFQNPYAISPILLGAKMTPDARNKEPIKAVSLTPEAAQETYDFLSQVISILDRHHIEYWLTYGTLLGAVRHEGIIPYDDDLDLNIWKKDVPKLQGLEKEFQEAGIGFSTDKLCLRVYKLDGSNMRPRSKTFQVLPGVWFVRRKKEKFPCCDFFPVEDIEGRIVNSNLIMRRDDPNAYFLKEELYPLKKVQFGTVSAYLPHEPKGYLTRHYKKDWNDMGYYIKSHSAGDQKSIAFQFTPELRQQFYQYGVQESKER